MSRALPLAGTLLAAALLSTNCANRAIAVQECREIEEARCRASARCGDLDSEVDDCVRFYRDQCLHGIAGPEAPSARQQSRCVDAIEAAGQCARDDREMLLSECQSDGAAGSGGGGEGNEEAPDPTVCEFVAEPWDHPTCDFLLPAPDEGQGGSEGEDE